MNEACFIVRDKNGHALAYVYFEDDPAAARLLTCSPRDEARRIAANTAKLPDLLTQKAGALHGEIIDEICNALEQLGADPPLLSVVGSIGDTMADEDVLQDLKLWKRRKAGDLVKSIEPDASLTHLKIREI